TALEVFLVDICDFEFASSRRFQSFGDRHYLLIVEIESRHGIFGVGLFGLFFQAKRFASAVELDHTVSLRIGNRIGKNLRTSARLRRLTQTLHQVMTIKNIVSQDQRATILPNELLADQKRLGNSFRLGLYGIV